MAFIASYIPHRMEPSDHVSILWLTEIDIHNSIKQESFSVLSVKLS